MSTHVFQESAENDKRSRQK